MAGNRRIVVGEITQGTLRGKALSDALYDQLCHEEAEDGRAVKNIMRKGKNH